MMVAGIVIYFHEERMSDDGAAVEAYHEDLGGNRRDG